MRTCQAEERINPSPEKRCLITDNTGAPAAYGPAGERREDQEQIDALEMTLETELPAQHHPGIAVRSLRTRVARLREGDPYCLLMPECSPLPGA